ncbi:MAG: CRISPR-associated protein Cas4 [Oscillospiraceae bacterium]
MHTTGIDGYTQDEFLMLSGLQHFLFCRRQWALIHIESLWAENLRTVSGQLMHERTHDESFTEKRGNTIVSRGMDIFSRSMGVSGKCDVVEFHSNSAGVPIHGWEGMWMPFPVEYKNGEPKENNCDAALLCGQAICLEEMLCCTIPHGALFYGKTKRRVPVEFTNELRQEVKSALAEMHQLYARGYTPKVKPTKACNACSLKELCLPSLIKRQPVKQYLEDSL